MKRTNFPGNYQSKLKTAISNLEARTKLPDADLVNTAKRFRKGSPTVDPSFIKEYRADMNAQIEHLKTLVK